MFSKTCEYALRALIFIAQHSQGGERLGVAEIAAGIDSPEYFIAKILQVMSRNGFVSSAKGPHGGFYMVDKNRKISLAAVVCAIDGDKLFVGCAIGLPQCSEKTPCPLHNDFMKIRASIRKVLENSTIESFVKDLELQRTFLKIKCN